MDSKTPSSEFNINEKIVELEVRPTILQPSDMYYNLLPDKAEASDDSGYCVYEFLPAKMNVKLEGQPAGVCEACLSSGRRLVRADSMRDVYASVLNEQYIPTLLNMNLCWECVALLRRVMQFKLRALRAQQWLLWAREQHHVEIPVTVSLSSLCSNIKTTYDSEFDAENPIIEIELPAHINSEPKHDESDHFDDIEVEIDTINDDIKLEDIKAEMFADIPKKKSSMENVKRKKNKDIGEKEDNSESEETVRKKRKKRSKANPFENYTVKTISLAEVEQKRECERNNPWYIKSPHKCETCIYGFRSEAQFNKHALTNHALEAGDHVCDVCAMRTRTKHLMDKHVKAHTEQYVCNACGATFGRIHTVRQHLTAKHKSRRCKYCCEEFFDLKSLYVHRRAAHLSFQCDKCGKKTTSKYTLKKHLRTHDPYPCNECHSVFSKKKNLDQHVRNRHEPNRSEAYCVECDRQFASRPSYLLHVTEKHSPAVRFRCPECDKPFNRKIYMKNHYNLMHLKKTNYYCKLCDKYICRKDGLRKHIEFVHEGKRLPKNKFCDLCGRGFSTNKTLVHHRRTHTGERPHKCEFCTAAFAQITALKTHVKHIHMQVKRNA